MFGMMTENLCRQCEQGLGLFFTLVIPAKALAGVAEFYPV